MAPRTSLFLATLLLLAAGPLEAQPPPDVAARLPAWEAGPYAGGSWHSPAGPRLGLIPDRSHLFVGIQLTRNFIRTERWALGYSPEITPLLLVTNNPKYRTRYWRGLPYVAEEGRAPVTGFAISPLGLQAQVRIARRLRLFASGNGGVVWFTRDVPIAYARRFNYTFDVGGGIRWQIRERDALRIAYKFHHLSNAATAFENPGLDAMVILAGYERAFGAK